VAGYTLLVNVECQSLAEGDEAITAGANIVMLDNIVGEELHSAAKELKQKWKGNREFLIETSGGIVEGGLVERLGPDIDILSTSAVHQVSPLVLFLVRSELMSRAVNMLTSRSRSSRGRNDDAAGYVCDAFSSFSSSRAFALVIDSAPTERKYELSPMAGKSSPTEGGSKNVNRIYASPKDRSRRECAQLLFI
jgi:hypothetical protein